MSTGIVFNSLKIIEVQWIDQDERLKQNAEKHEPVSNFCKWGNLPLFQSEVTGTNGVMFHM